MDPDLFNLLAELYDEDATPVLLKSECRYNFSGKKDYYYSALAYVDDIYDDTLSKINRIKDLLKDYKNVEFNVVGDSSSIALELWGDILEKLPRKIISHSL